MLYVHAHCQPSSHSNRLYDNNLFSDQGTLAQNVEDQPMFNQIQNNSELDENALNLYPQTLSQASNGNAEANSQR